MADAFEELNSVRAGRGRGIRAVLPAAWSLEAGPMGPAEGPDFHLEHERSTSRIQARAAQSLWLLRGDGGGAAGGDGQRRGRLRSWVGRGVSRENQRRASGRPPLE